MKKRDFMQQAAIQFMPKTEWNMDKSIAYAEKLWTRLDQKGYGEGKEIQPKQMVNYYQQLSRVQAQQFDQFWIAFDHKQGKQRAAMRWKQMGNQHQDELKKIIAAAKRTAAARKNLKPDQTPIMAEGWLSQLRFDDFDQSTTEIQQKKTNNFGIQVREITSALNHAKKMQQTTGEQFWNIEVARLTEKLKELRDADQEN